jgi:hypothetical protein
MTRIKEFFVSGRRRNSTRSEEDVVTKFNEFRCGR